MQIYYFILLCFGLSGVSANFFLKEYFLIKTLITLTGKSGLTPGSRRGIVYSL